MRKRVENKDLSTSNSGFEAFGKPVPMARRSAALDHIREMGITDIDSAWGCIGSMAEMVARDQPFAAMNIGMAVVGLTGAYRLIAVLCTGAIDDCTFTVFFTETNTSKTFSSELDAHGAAQAYVGNSSGKRISPNESTYLYGPGDGTTSVIVRQDFDIVSDPSNPLNPTGKLYRGGK